MGLFSNKNKRKSLGRADGTSVTITDRGVHFKKDENGLLTLLEKKNLKDSFTSSIYDAGDGSFKWFFENPNMGTIANGITGTIEEARSELERIASYHIDSARKDASARPNYSGDTSKIDPMVIAYINDAGQYDLQSSMRQLETEMRNGLLVGDKYTQELAYIKWVESRFDSARSDMTDGEVQTLQRNFQEIVEFYERTGATPKKDKTNPVEYQLGARLAHLRNQPENMQALAGMDSHKLLTRSDEKQTQGKTMNTLKQDGKQYLLKTDAYEKRFDSEPQAMLFAKRHNIDLNDKAPARTDGLSSDIANLKNQTENLIQYVNGADLTKVRKVQSILDEIEASAKKYNTDADEKPADKKEDDEPELDADGNPIEKEKKEEKKDAKVNLDSKIPTFKAIRADESYNGYKNYETWNVSLWIANDYGIYQTAVEYAKSASNPTYRDFIGYAGLSGSTPDGVSWTDPDLDYNKLNQEFVEYRNDSADRTDEERKDEYNGWANRATWNVALWIGNDYGLYQMAVEYMNDANNGTYKDFVAYAGLSGATPDGISWTDGDLNYSELNTMMREL